MKHAAPGPSPAPAHSLAAAAPSPAPADARAATGPVSWFDGVTVGGLALLSLQWAHAGSALPDLLHGHGLASVAGPALHDLGTELALILLVATGVLLARRARAAQWRQICHQIQHLARGELRAAAAAPQHAIPAALRRELEHLRQQIARLQGDAHTCSQELTTLCDELLAGLATLAPGSKDTATEAERCAEAALLAAQAARSLMTGLDDAANDALQGVALADEGRLTVQTMAAGMAGIRLAADRIVGIVKAMDGITRQTEILALNATVEAARAGPQGAGFGVVAEEVRRLAGRQFEAMRQILQQVDSTLAAVGLGEETARRGRQTLDSVVAAAHQIGTQIDRAAQAALAHCVATQTLAADIDALGRRAGDQARLAAERAAQSREAMLDRPGAPALERR